MPPSGSALAPAPPQRPALRLLDPPPLRVADVALFYGERSGGIRTYLDSQGAVVARDRRDRAPRRRARTRASATTDGVHELPSLRVRRVQRLPRAVSARRR